MYSYPHKTAYRPFDVPIDIKNYLDKEKGKDASLYFHIPFCKYKCGYCNLFSQQNKNPGRIQEYLETLQRQAEQLSLLTKELNFTSLAIGGGTPLLLDNAQLSRLFEIIALFNINPENVFTSIETSPDYTDPESLQELKNKGIERLSIGIQSFHQDELYSLGRRTTIENCLTALNTIRQTEFPQFNIDLIYGIKEQTVDRFIGSIQTAISYQPTELFIYPLYVREGVKINNRAANENIYNLYKAGRNELIKEGFIQTSMRRFVRKHSPDLEYSCGDETMLSCGCGGRSYISDLHFAAPYAVNQKRIKSIIDQYIQTTDFTQINNGFILSVDEQKRRYIIKNFMYYRGIDKEDYKLRFKEEVTDTFDFDRLFDKGFIEELEGFLKLTEKGMAFSDDIGQLFISPYVRNRMDEYILE